MPSEEADLATPPRYRAFTSHNFLEAPGAGALKGRAALDIEIVSTVFPFKTNAYVCEQLINWQDVPADPLYQLTFPQPEMLEPGDFATIARLRKAGAPAEVMKQTVREIHSRMNPNPAGQGDLNLIWDRGMPLKGIQQQYAESVLFFPAHGQTCHAYCSFCFRWPQFVGTPELRFVSREVDGLVAHLRRHPEITDVIFTGGDPLVMGAELLRRYVEPLLAPDLEHVNIRFGTKVLAYWPFRFVSDPDADTLLQLLEGIVAAGRHLAVMAHVSHPRELQTEIAQKAIRRLLAAGAVIRCQSPLVKHVNDSSATWTEMIRAQVKLSMVPYYMFVVRDTGARRYFEIPLNRALNIYRESCRSVSGLGRTLRGPVMSTTPGKILIEDVVSIGGGPVFALRFVNGRRREWSNRLFFADFDPDAAWWDELRPAFGHDRWFFQSSEDPWPPRRESSGAEGTLELQA